MDLPSWRPITGTLTNVRYQLDWQKKREGLLIELRGEAGHPFRFLTNEPSIIKSAWDLTRHRGLVVAGCVERAGALRLVWLKRHPVEPRSHEEATAYLLEHWGESLRILGEN